MSSIDESSMVAFAFVLPPLYGAVGAWLSHLGTTESAWDEFFSPWPFASIGAFIAAVCVLHLGA